MNTEMRDLLTDMVNRLLSDHCNGESWAALDNGEDNDVLWQVLAEQGLPQAGVASEKGGSDLGIADLMALARLTGYHACPVPLVETMLHNWLADQAGQPAAVGFGTLAGLDEWPLPTVSDQGRLTGRLYLVPWASEANAVITIARGADGVPGLAAFAPDADGVQMHNVANIAAEPRSNLTLKQVPVLWHQPLPDGMTHTITDMLLALARSAQMAGAMERAVEMSTVYVMERVQFGRPLARFQAVQHMLAEAAQHFAASAAMTECAADCFGRADFDLLVAAAKARSSEAVRPVTDAVHQVHGAMGFTREYALQFFTRRLWSWRDEAGAESRWQQMLGKHLLNSDEPLWSMLTTLAR